MTCIRSDYPVHSGSFKFDDTDLRDNDLVRIYDVVIPYSDGLMATDELLRDLLIQPEFQKEMGTAELHHCWENTAPNGNAKIN